MSMSKRPEELMQNLLSLDDTFAFRCVGCGKCCIQREDILLTARDLFRAAKHLGLKTEEFVDTYCECYIGGTSKLPVVRLKPEGANHHCPMLNGKKCLIHAAKPIVCALFPLGRMVTGEKNDADGGNAPAEIKTVYIKQDVSCPTNRNTTVRKWLERFGIDTHDVFQRRWSQLLMDLAGTLHAMQDSGKADPILEDVYSFLCTLLYIRYDMSMPFEDQFEANALVLEEFIEKAKLSFPQTEEGQNK